MTTEQWIVPASRGELVITRATPADVDALTAIYEETERWRSRAALIPACRRCHCV